MSLPPVVAVEIGTSKVIALVGELREDGVVMTTGIGELPAAGVRKGEIIDMENAVTCVRSVLEKAEETGNVAIRQVHLALSGGHVQSFVNRGSVPVQDRVGGITGEDVDQVMKVARAINLPPDREVLHTLCQHFRLDDQERVVNPEGMEGALLSLDMLVLHGVRSRLHNTIKVLRGVPVEVEDVAFSGLCSAMSVLTPEQKKGGSVVIDLGGGTTDFVAYADGVVAAAGALAVGGDHVTNDIALAFSIPTAQAEKLKRGAGAAVIEPEAAARRVTLPADVGFNARELNLKALQTVINARLDEILGTVRRRLDEQGIPPRIGAGIVLTGGGARLQSTTQLAESIFGLPCSLGKPRGISGLATASDGPQYATCAGLIQYAFKAMEDQAAPSSFGGWLKGLFGR